MEEKKKRFLSEISLIAMPESEFAKHEKTFMEKEELYKKWLNIIIIPVIMKIRPEERMLDVAVPQGVLLSELGISEEEAWEAAKRNTLDGVYIKKVGTMPIEGGLKEELEEYGIQTKHMTVVVSKEADAYGTLMILDKLMEQEGIREDVYITPMNGLGYQIKPVADVDTPELEMMLDMTKEQKRCKNIYRYSPATKKTSVIMMIGGEKCM